MLLTFSYVPAGTNENFVYCERKIKLVKEF